MADLDRRAELGGVMSGSRLRPYLLPFVAALIVLAVEPTVTAPGMAKDAPKCGNKVATIVGTDKAETIVGTDKAETIVGTAKADVIVALGGADIVRGLGGADRICGGGGKDKLIGGAGKDKLAGDVSM
jgi:Ca2+-binding RTX toxin-like protein